MKVLDVEQGTESWMAARCGRITASDMSRLIKSDGTPAALGTMRRYAEELAVETLTGQSATNFSSKDADRGHALEPVALREYSRLTGREVERVGFVLTDDESCGCSPDGLVVGDDAAVEAKTKNALLHAHAILDRLRLDSPPPEFMAQCWGVAKVCERERTDLILTAWDAEMPSPIWRVYLTDGVRRTLEQQVRACLELKAEALEKLRDPANWRARDVRVEAPAPTAEKARRAA